MAATRVRRRGSALIESVVVVSVAAVAVGLGLPAVQQAREASARARCRENLRQIGAAVLRHESASGVLPKNAYEPLYSGDTIHKGLFVVLLPHLGRDALFRTYDFRADYFAAVNQPVLNAKLAVVRCPAAPPTSQKGIDRGWADADATTATYTAEATDYSPLSSSSYPIGPPGDETGVAALNPTLGDWKTSVQPTLSLATDGASQSVVVAESAAMSQHWVKGKMVKMVNPLKPGTRAPWAGMPWLFNSTASADGTPEGTGTGPCTINCNNEEGIYSFHSGGANVLVLDGSVRFLKEGTDARILFALISRAGGEVIGVGDYSPRENP